MDKNWMEGFFDEHDLEVLKEISPDMFRKRGIEFNLKNTTDALLYYEAYLQEHPDEMAEWQIDSRETWIDKFLDADKLKQVEGYLPDALHNCGLGTKLWYIEKALVHYKEYLQQDSDETAE